jgi:hypothetical protein
VSRKREQLHGKKPVLTGLLLMALVYGGVEASRAFGTFNKIEFVVLGGLILAWIPVLLGTLTLRKERPEFEYAFYGAAVSVVALFAQSGLGLKNFLDNMGEQTFIQLDVMFFGYIALLGMVFVYRMMMKGINGQAGEGSGKKASTEWKTVWLVGLIVIFAGLLFLPLAGLFSLAVEKIVTAVIVLVIMGTELYWCGYINRGALALEKKR